MKKIKPLALLQYWVLLIIVMDFFVILFSNDYAGSQVGFTFFFNSIFFFFIGLMIWCVTTVLLYREWFKKHWLLILALFIVSIWYTVGTYRLQH